MSHGFLPVCLLKLFTLVWVVSLFLSALSLPLLYILHCLFFGLQRGLFWLDVFSFVGSDRMVLDNFYNFTLKFWILLWSVNSKTFNWALLWFGPLFWLAFVHCCDGDSTGSFGCTFWGLFWYLSLGDLEQPRRYSQKWAIPCYLNPPSRQSPPPPLQQQRPLLQRQNPESL